MIPPQYHNNYPPYGFGLLNNNFFLPLLDNTLIYLYFIPKVSARLITYITIGLREQKNDPSIFLVPLLQ